ncbi:MAG TPA: shikimate dehydrogenase [Candidatus Nitrosocosmicus sp.]|nr:shikimate dehydrogenase [Candidatus Nitrosocosmicus sp.]
MSGIGTKPSPVANREADIASKAFCIIGNPIEHSLSPLMQNAAFRHVNLNYSYIAFKVPADELEVAVESMRKIRIAGFNVTIPHKVEIVKLLDKLSDEALIAGSVNTVNNENGVLVGYNTDIDGVLEPIEKRISSFEDLNVLILGAGGSCRAALVGLAKKEGINSISIFNRDQNKLNKIIRLGRDLKLNCIPFEFEDTTRLSEVTRNSGLIINTTSMGLQGEKSPIKSDFICKNSVVFDIVYKPINTDLIDNAKKAGAKIIFGYEMLLSQGYKAFEIWTGLKAPREIMKQALFGIFGEPK